MTHPLAIQWGGPDAVPAIEKMREARKLFEASFHSSFPSLHAAIVDQIAWESVVNGGPLPVRWHYIVSRSLVSPGEAFHLTATEAVESWMENLDGVPTKDRKGSTLIWAQHPDMSMIGGVDHVHGGAFVFQCLAAFYVVGPLKVPPRRRVLPAKKPRKKARRAK